ncbi:hypothetical protein [Maricaulis sp.]|uniref:hypothetical protein n=1 Tax=Maricaulis sp. TaxID=1486257 RepID=UPI00260DDCC0|nr:hypothetical protein [Maricaulis sp.]
MTATDFIWPLAALAASVGGIVLLRRAWARRRNRHAWFVALGWIALCLATVLWTPPYPPVYAIALSVLAIECLALLAVFRKTNWRETSPETPIRRETAPAPAPAWRTGLRGVAVTLLAGPAAMAGAIVLSLLLFGLARIAGWNDADQLALALFAVPVIWTVLAALAVVDMKLRWRTASILLPLLLGGGLLALIA